MAVGVLSGVDGPLVYDYNNETVDGVEFARFPKSVEPRPDGPIIVADII